jgi:ABC-2 type transport system permease protein
MPSHHQLVLIIFCFLFYFIGGYLFYSALFAAVGSAVNEDPQEAQSLMLPITLPVIFSFIIMSVAVQDPGARWRYGPASSLSARRSS